MQATGAVAQAWWPGRQAVCFASKRLAPCMPRQPWHTPPTLAKVGALQGPPGSCQAMAPVERLPATWARQALWPTKRLACTLAVGRLHGPWHKPVFTVLQNKSTWRLPGHRGLARGAQARGVLGPCWLCMGATLGGPLCLHLHGPMGRTHLGARCAGPRPPTDPPIEIKSESASCMQN